MINLKTILKHKWTATFIVTILILIHLLWDHYHGGVPKHYLLHSKDYPGFSNWFGLITIPLITWGSLGLIQRRVNGQTALGKDVTQLNRRIIQGFLGALFFGVAFSFMWYLNLEAVMPYAVFLPVLISIFYPVYYPEHLLGFILGMVYTFGGVLPLIFSIVLILLCFIADKSLGRVVRFYLRQ